MDFLKFEEEDSRGRLRDMLQRKAFLAGGAVLAFALALFIISLVSRVWSSHPSGPSVNEEKQAIGSYAGTTPDIGTQDDRIYGPPRPSGEFDYEIQEDDTLTSILSPYGIEHNAIAKRASEAGDKG